MFGSELVINSLDTLEFNYICSMHNYGDTDMQAIMFCAKKKKKDISTLNIKIVGPNGRAV